MKKTKIKIRAKNIICANKCEMARLAVNNWDNKIIHIADNADKAKINFANIDLIKFWVCTQILLIDNV